MNPLDRLLREEVSSSLERMAASSPEGTLAFITAHHASLRDRVEEGEVRLAALRAELLERYAEWEATLEEIENLWALAALKRSQPREADLLPSAA